METTMTDYTKLEAYPRRRNVGGQFAYADAAAAAAAKFQDTAIDILDGAIRLGPNGGESLTPFAERIHELRARGFVAA